MEIPYIVKARKDTGLFNSKIAIWLFLASEVMLFGGFFSAYVFLRVGADYPWPERTLPVLPGLINTFILIGSSVTVVFAWAALKMRQWRQFQIYMGITIACAAIFMVLKGLEYSVKFGHQGVRLNDYSVIEGHLAYKKDGEEYAKSPKGKKIEENKIHIEAGKLTFSTTRFHSPWVRDLVAQAEAAGSTITLIDDVEGVSKEGEAPVKIASAGTEVSPKLLSDIQKAHIKARNHNGKMRTRALSQEWVTAKRENPGKQGWQIASDVQIDMVALSPRLLTEYSTVAFQVEPPVEFLFNPRDVREGEATSRLRDDTVIEGTVKASPMVFHNVDAIDFQHLVMRAVDRGIDPIVAIENSYLYQNEEFVREAWAWHQKKVDKLQERLIKDYGYKKGANGRDTDEPKREPTQKERYRIGWKELAEKAEDEGRTKLGFITTISEEFKGPNYVARGTETFPELTLPREEIRFAAKFTPAWNSYYAIYFTITGLHGLHVIGGAIVLAYYLFFGRRMYLENPEWLANRVEVGGLFWHFVDLVWIFAFPIFYLM